MNGICQRECDNKTELGYCKTTWCIKPLHLNEKLATNLQPTCNKTDLIRRQDAIDAIKKSAMYIPEASTELYMALLAIEELPSVASKPMVIHECHRWIPCSEALPKEGQSVLVWFEYFRYGSYQCLYQTYGIATYPWNGFINGESGWKKLRVIAWRPLPEPYRGD